MALPAAAKVLVVDGDKNSLEVTHALLLKEGYRVEKACRLREAFQFLQREKMDVLIIDVEMPEMKSYEAIPLIKGMDPNLPIIMTAEENSPELESQVRHHGVFYYHLKSFGFEELKLAVENAIKKSSVSDSVSGKM
jgi:DNA-binding NtrC family response regulator